MKTAKQILPGLFLCAGVALLAFLLNGILPTDLLGSSLLALIIGMVLNPFAEKHLTFRAGIDWTSKRILRTGIILTGITLSFGQIFEAGRYALFLMMFTLSTAFGVGYICSKVFNINWKLSSLLSVSTAICGGTAVATLGPTIGAEDRDIAYAISATFLFDLITVIAFPWIGRLLGLSDTGYGLWIGTAVNDTSSVIAAGYAFSDAAGGLATVVKLTRTLFIVPIVIVFSWINAKKELALTSKNQSEKGQKIQISKIFPWFILGFLAMVGLKSTNLLPQGGVDAVSGVAKAFLAMALGAIGLKTSLKEVSGVGIKPMVAGVVIDTSVVIISLLVLAYVLQIAV